MVSLTYHYVSWKSFKYLTVKTQFEKNTKIKKLKKKILIK
jgi:hypothetical protein